MSNDDVPSRPQKDKKPDRQNEPGRHPGHAPGERDAVPTRRKPYPPDSIPDPMPGVDPQQTPGIDRSPAEWRQEA
jgi:hypothetical protein